MIESSEILILPDGRILAHNITPEMAIVLCELDPGNQAMKERAARHIDLKLFTPNQNENSAGN